MRERMRSINWAGLPSSEAKKAHDSYVADLQRAGLYPWPEPDAYYVTALPDEEEAMSRTVTFRQHRFETAPEPICYDCPDGGDPVPVVVIRGKHVPLHDGDRVTVSRRGRAIGVQAEPLRE